MAKSNQIYCHITKEVYNPFAERIKEVLSISHSQSVSDQSDSMGVSPLSVLLLLLMFIHCGQSEEKLTPTLRVDPHTTVYTGDTFTLTCDLQSSLTGWVFSWYKVSNPLESLKEKTPNTLSITASDTGTTEYQCKASRGQYPTKYRTEYSDPLKITVREKPKPALTVNPQTTVYTGDRLTLTCDLKISPTGWTFFWYREKELFPPSPANQDSNTLSITVSDTADYQCSARRANYDTERSDPVRITVEKPKPALRVYPHTTVYTGETLTLTCDLKISLTGWKFMWFRDSQQLQSLTPDYKDTNTLSITVSDTAEYQCAARRGENIYTDVYSDPVKITVEAVPKPKLTSSLTGSALRGSSVTLQCELDQSAGWKFYWSKDTQNNLIKSSTGTHSYTIRSVSDSDGGQYWCRAGIRDIVTSYSDAFWVKITGEAQAVLSVSPQSWLTEGDSVTLSCEVRHSSTGWTFSWYRDGEKLVSDSRREAGGSYTLSPAALNHTGVYECRAERGEPAFHTQTSNPQPLWITASSPPVSLMVRPSRTQHFTNAPLSLSCEDQSDSTGWRVRRYSHSGNVSDCTSGWGSGTGSTCNISSLSTSHTGVYWCQSESGGRSYPAIITVHNGAVILDSPVHPVSEGDPLTLRCLYRLKPSNLTADFYKDGSFLQTQPAGEMTIPAASKTHEGLYHCKHPEKGESPTSWISVRVLSSSFSVLCLLGCLVAASPYLLASIILGVKCYRARAESDEVSRT